VLIQYVQFLTFVLKCKSIQEIRGVVTVIFNFSGCIPIEML